MPSTYTLNNGIELIGTGEQSGTWGDTTNTNLQLLDSALDGQVTVTLASAGSSGSPNALPISDGAASNGRNRMVVFDDGADLGATAYVQLTPNDAEKIIYIRNDLSGSRSIILFQGTYNASNDYEVPAGTTAIVYFDGAGSGAVAANVFNNAHFDAMNVVGNVTVGGNATVTGTVDAGTVEFDNLSGTGAVSVTNILDEDNMASDSATALATQQSIKAYVDAQVGANNELSEVLANGNTTGGTDIAVSSGDDITFADSSKAIFGAGSDLQIYHDGSNSYVKDAGTGDLKIQGASVSIETGGGNLYFKGDSNVALLYHTNNQKLATTSTGVDITGTLTSDGLTVDGNDVFFNNGWIKSNSSLRIDVDNDNNQTDRAFFVSRGNASADMLKVSENGDISFYEDTGTTPKFFWDASAESLGIGTSAPSYPLHVQGTTSAGDVAALVTNHSNDGSATLRLSPSTISTRGAFIRGLATSASGQPTDLLFATGAAYSDATERMRIDSSGNVGINTASPTQPLDVNGNVNVAANISSSADSYIYSYAGGSVGAVLSGFQLSGSGNTLQMFTASTERMRIDSSGNVGIGTSSPAGKLHVSAAAPASVPSAGTAGHPLAVGTNPYGLAGGALSSGNAYLQSTRWDGTATNYDLLLQPNGGRVGIGTSTPTAYLQIGALAGGDRTFQMYSAGATRGVLSTDGASGIFSIGATNDSTTGILTFKTGAALTERLRIDSSGNVGIGTSSISPVFGTTVKIFNSGSGGTLEIGGSSVNLRMFGSEGLSLGGIAMTTNHPLAFYTNDTERMRIDASGNVGIGTSSPNSYASKRLHLNGSSTSVALRLTTTTTGSTVDDGSDIEVSGSDLNIINRESANTVFFTANAERMRIDSSGNVMVGKTSPAGVSTNGVELRNDGIVIATKASGISGYFGRTSTDGEIVRFYRDSTPMGSIGTGLSSLAIGTGNTQLMFWNAQSGIFPSNGTTVTDNSINFGNPNYRFKDLYLSGGVYLGGTTSDNLLDDYEEGTWTPTVFGTGTAGTATYAQAVGTYTKVGNLVYAQCYVAFSSFTGTNNLQVRGLPFVGESGAYETHSGGCIIQNMPLPSGTVQVTPRAQDGQSYIYFKCTKDNASEALLQCATGPSTIELSVTYRTN
jgi:hypothetical protein